MPFYTGTGVWNPIFWSLAMLSAVIISLFLVSGSPTGKKNTGDAGMPFLSGNPEELRNNIKVSNMYWGLMEALKGYFKILDDMHTGILHDYVFWYVAVLAVALVIVLF
jgi:hypothetical protein